MSAGAEGAELKRAAYFPSRRGRRGTLSIPAIPLFERILYYMLAPDFVARIIFEFGLGMNFYYLNQQKQWCIYILLLCEYAHQLRLMRHSKFRVHFGMWVSLLLFVMLIHGALVGVVWGNKPGKIFTDSVPLVIMICNIAFLSKIPVFEGVDFNRIRKVVYVYGVVMLSVGFIAVKMGKPSIISMGGSMGGTISLSVIMVTLAFKEKLTPIDIFVSLFLLLGALPTFSRTSLVVVTLAACYLVLPRILRSPWALYSASAFLIVGSVFASTLVPDDSPLMRRIEGTLNYDPTATTGAIGERQAEVEAIQAHLSDLGPYAHAFGVGAGGTYTVVLSLGQIPENYSHAHYGWALFKLRYGYVGYFYLAIFVFCLLFSMIRNFRKGTIEGAFIGLLALWGFVFVFTYMFQNQLTAGLQFSDPPISLRRRRSGISRPSINSLTVRGRRKGSNGLQLPR